MMPTVLLVDDSDETREVYATMLTYHDMDVLEARNGEEGVRMAFEHKPDVIVMNVAMPVVDGLTAADALRADERTAGIPVIACTGYVREDGADEARQAGCAAYLEKPCSPQRLLAEVQRLLPDPVRAAGT